MEDTINSIPAKKERLNHYIKESLRTSNMSLDEFKKTSAYREYLKYLYESPELLGE